MDHGQSSPAEKTGAKDRMQRRVSTIAIVFAIGMSSASVALASPAVQAPEADAAGMKVAEGIPGRCNTYDMSERIEHDLPRIAGHAGSVTTVSNVEFLTDVRRVTYSPAAGREPELHMLQCPVRITWDNGHQDFGYYTEWEDSNQQVRVSFAPKPMHLSALKQ